MNKKAQIGFGGIIILFAGIIFAIALLTPIFDTQAEMTTKQTIDNKSISTVTAFVGDNEVNETFTYTLYADQSTWKESECPLSSVVIRNGAGTELTDNTDYTLAEDTGVYSLLNTSKTVPATALNLTYADYTYCMDGYNTDSGARSIAGLIGLFSVLALLGFVIWKSGVLDLKI
ncbi:MAG: hypothetical protein U9Q99_00860 [Nanoarchaeota archaeon]|nr:hypothetical protein [Nanoarchaeota archaeon]